MQPGINNPNGNQSKKELENNPFTPRTSIKIPEGQSSNIFWKYYK